MKQVLIVAALLAILVGGFNGGRVLYWYFTSIHPSGDCKTDSDNINSAIAKAAKAGGGVVRLGTGLFCACGLKNPLPTHQVTLRGFPYADHCVTKWSPYAGNRS